MSGRLGGRPSRYTVELYKRKDEAIVMIQDNQSGMATGVIILIEKGHRVSLPATGPLSPGDDPEQLTKLKNMLKGIVLAVDQFGLIPKGALPAEQFE